jgi:hypothetical protein
MTHASYPANSALLAQSWEISVSEKVRGGLGRTRTINQNLTGPALAFRHVGTQSLHPSLQLN